MPHQSLLNFIGDAMLSVLYILMAWGGYAWLRFAFREIRDRK